MYIGRSSGSSDSTGTSGLVGDTGRLSLVVGGSEAGGLEHATNEIVSKRIIPESVKNLSLFISTPPDEPYPIIPPTNLK